MPNGKEIQQQNARLREENARLKELIQQSEAQFSERLQTREDELTEQFQSRVEEINQAHAEEIERVQIRHAIIIGQVFAKRSERYIDNPDQMLLDLFVEGADELNEQTRSAVDALREAVDEAAGRDTGDANEQPADGILPGEQPDEEELRRREALREERRRAAAEKRERERERRRDENGVVGKFPRHMVNETIEIRPDESKIEGMIEIGYDVVQTAYSKPPEIHVVEKRYYKYADRQDRSQGVVSAPRPKSKTLTAGGHYDVSIFADLITGRFAYHLPFYRLQDTFAAAGWEVSRSTLANIQRSGAQLLRPLYDYFADRIRTDSVIATDDTGVKLLVPKKLPELDVGNRRETRAHEVLSAAMEQQKRHINAKFWAYRGVQVPLNLFDMTVSRHRDGPDWFFVDSNYKGTLLGDCFGANTGIAMRSNGSIVHAACVAHARRKFVAALKNHKRHCRFFLNRFQELYEIEDRCATMSPEERLTTRRLEASLVWQRIDAYIDRDTRDLVPKDETQRAIDYLQNHWDALRLYLDNASIPIDNNECEQLMRQVATGRKNWLFVGSLQAGEEMSTLMSIVSSAVRNHVHVRAYLSDITQRILDGETDYASMLPAVWRESNPQHHREYRTEERDVKEHRKRELRQHRRLTNQA